MVELRINAIDAAGAFVGDIYLDQNSPVTQVLSSDNMRTFSASSYQVVHKSLYKSMPIPTRLADTAFVVSVRWLEQHDTSILVWLTFTNDNNALDESITKSLRDAVDMDKQLLKYYEARSLRKLDFFEVKDMQACCCMFDCGDPDMIKTFYRAHITSVNYIESTARVRYVDFGNEDDISFDK